MGDLKIDRFGAALRAREEEDATDAGAEAPGDGAVMDVSTVRFAPPPGPRAPPRAPGATAGAGAGAEAGAWAGAKCGCGGRACRRTSSTSVAAGAAGWGSDLCCGDAGTDGGADGGGDEGGDAATAVPVARAAPWACDGPSPTMTNGSFRDPDTPTLPLLPLSAVTGAGAANAALFAASSATAPASAPTALARSCPSNS